MASSSSFSSSHESRNMSALEREVYFLVGKFLSSGPCQKSAQVLREELEELKERQYSHLEGDHLLQILSRLPALVDKEVEPAVSGLKTLLGAGRQSLLRSPGASNVSWSLKKCYVRLHGKRLIRPGLSHRGNLAQILIGRETSAGSGPSDLVPPSMMKHMVLQRRTLGHISAVYCLAFDRTGRYIFTGADDSLVKIWSAFTGRLITTLRGASSEITDLVINDENTLIAAGSTDKIIRVWCLKTAAPVAVLPGLSAMTNAILFCSATGDLTRHRYLVTGSGDGTVAFWTYTVDPDGRNAQFCPHPEKFHERMRPGHASILCLSFSMGGHFLASGSADHHIRVYHLYGKGGVEGPKRILESEAHSESVDSIQWANQSMRFVSGSKDGTALIWSYHYRDWSQVVLKMSTRLNGSSEEGEDGRGQKVRTTMVAWTKDDRHVITAVSTKELKIWDSLSGILQHVLKGHKYDVYVMEPHPLDPNVLLTAGHDGQLFVWDLNRGVEVLRHWNGIEQQGYGALFDAKWNPMGHSFAATDSHGHLLLFGFGSPAHLSYERLPEQLFFHTDLRPLMHDAAHHVLDEQTQLPPHLMPPPFLVDLEGNPYPPKFQRLVPGRENCQEEQLVPQVVYDEDGDPMVLDDRGGAGPGEQRENLSNIDQMIERLAIEQGQAPAEVSPVRRHPAEGTRQTRANRIQRMGEGSSNEVPVHAEATNTVVSIARRRVIVPELPSWQLKAILQYRKVLKEAELGHFDQESRKARPQKESEYQRSEDRESYSGNWLRSRRLREAHTQHGYSTRRSRHLRSPDPVPNGRESRSATNSGDEIQRETHDRQQETDSSQSELTEQGNQDMEQDRASSPSSSSSSSDSSETSEYSDWMAEAGVRMEPPKRTRKRTVQAPSRQQTHGRLRTRNHLSSRRSNHQRSNQEHSTPSQRRPRSVRSGRGEGQEELESSSEESEESEEIPEIFRPSKWLSEVRPRDTPYFPQMGDEVMYFRQGHELYLEHVQKTSAYSLNQRDRPWNRVCNIREQELVKVTGMHFELRPPRLACIKLSLVNPSTGRCSETNFTIKYHDMNGVLDFLVLKQIYDRSMGVTWRPGDRFRVRVEEDYSYGTYTAHTPYSEEYPDSPFLCCEVTWDTGDSDRVSPWDMEPISDASEVAPLYIPSPSDWPHSSQEVECDRISLCIQQVMELAIAEHFVAPVDLNTYPDYALVVEYPIDLSTIKARATLSRLDNRFYRRLAAVQFDVRYVAADAERFNQPGSLIVHHAQVITEICLRMIRDQTCQDILPLYRELMAHEREERGEVTGASTSRAASAFPSPPIRNRRKLPKHQTWESQCEQMLNVLLASEDSEPFQTPVDLEDYPDYEEVIQNPMDLSTVKGKVQSGSYASPEEFSHDINLIFRNSKDYNTNKRSRIYSMTLRLQGLFESRMAPIIKDYQALISKKQLSTKKLVKKELHLTNGHAGSSGEELENRSPIRTRLRERVQNPRVSNSQIHGGREGGRMLRPRRPLEDNTRFMGFIITDTRLRQRNENTRIRKPSDHADVHSTDYSSSHSSSDEEDVEDEELAEETGEEDEEDETRENEGHDEDNEEDEEEGGDDDDNDNENNREGKRSARPKQLQNGASHVQGLEKRREMRSRERPSRVRCDPEEESDPEVTRKNLRKRNRLQQESEDESDSDAEMSTRRKRHRVTQQAKRKNVSNVQMGTGRATRNRGRNTVRYHEDSDLEDGSLSDVDLGHSERRALRPRRHP
ncbi:unnamed protein product [Darwinula stevensoni]|uniref:Bromo domain-containing protein n=1 Tax=Darwinula stevensoni TaxID=69355 RepID=A0A7R8X7Y4_9CRUS|nr:unnamed protein product [Darwinula stevensoni]CAG0887382.1 unnamed protein product [Darwinula stevensoni]